MSRRTLLLACAFTVVTMACTSAPKPSSERELTAADSAAPVQASVGDVFILRLDSNISTGYGWSWDQSAAAGVVVQDGDPQAMFSNPGMPGAGGVQTWRFRAATRGEGDLHLDYRRSWEKDVPPVRSVRWRIQVR